mgnify:CR=1 FL=1
MTRVWLVSCLALFAPACGVEESGGLAATGGTAGATGGGSGGITGSGGFPSGGAGVLFALGAGAQAGFQRELVDGSGAQFTGEELEEVWADKKPAKAALDTSVSRGNAVLSAKPLLKKAQPF